MPNHQQSEENNVILTKAGYQTTYLVADGLRHDVGVRVREELVVECGAGQNHRQLAAVVGIVVPGTVLGVPGVVPTRKSDQTIPVFPPDPEPEDDFVVTQLRVVVDRQDGLRLDRLVRKKPVVEAVLFGADDLDGNADVRPTELFRRRVRRIPDNQNFVQVRKPEQPGQRVHQNQVSLVGEHHDGELLVGNVPADGLAELVA